MGYLHINDLYKAQEILMFKECYALEKIHGTSAHIGWRKNEGIHFFSGGNSYNIFTGIFNEEHQKHMTEVFSSMGYKKVKVFGESYGGKTQAMSNTYGKRDRFVVFDVKIDDLWLNVPNAEQLSQSLYLDFVPYIKCSTDLEVLTQIREMPSEQAIKCGITEPRKREGIVLRSLIELRKNNDERIIAKFKNDDFIETKTRHEVSSDRLAILTEAKAVADEWVTEMRLTHILQKFPDARIEKTGEIVKAMIEDIEREAYGEIIPSRDIRKEIGKVAATMFKNRLKDLQKLM